MAISVQFSSWRVRLIKVLRRKNCWEKQSQKRACCTCLFLHPDNMLRTPTENDRVISVELPQKEDDPLLHD